MSHLVMVSSNVGKKVEITCMLCSIKTTPIRYFSMIYFRLLQAQTAQPIKNKNTLESKHELTKNVSLFFSFPGFYVRTYKLPRKRKSLQ